VRVERGETIERTEDEVRVRRLLEFGGDLESRASRVYALGGRGGIESLLHSVEPRLHYIRLIGRNFYQLPNWTPRVDRIPEGNWLEYSLTNRLRARTVAGPDAEPVRYDLVRFVVAHAYDVQENRVGNVAADLIVQPSARLRVRGDASYNVEGAGVQAATTDLQLLFPSVTANVGTRYVKSSPGEGPTAGIVPDFVVVPGTYNVGGRPANTAAVNFIEGGIVGELSRHFVVRARTSWDVKTDTFVENRFGVDFRWDCWALALEYVDRNRAGGGGRAEDELRFSLNLLGLGASLGTRLGTGADAGAGPRFK
jgi:hypothetical protein